MPALSRGVDRGTWHHFTAAPASGLEGLDSFAWPRGTLGPRRLARTAMMRWYFIYVCGH